MEAAIWVTLEFASIDFDKKTIFYWVHIFLAGVWLGKVYADTPLKFGVFGQKKAVQIFFLILLFAAPIMLPEVRRALGLPVLPNFLDPISVGYPFLLLMGALAHVRTLGWFKMRGLRFYGKISFGLYLLHMPVITFFSQPAFAIIPGPVIFILVFVISTALAVLAFNLIENPSRLLFRKRAPVERPVFVKNQGV